MRRYGTQIARRPSFTKGDRILFQQTTPSPGWVKETAAAYNDATPRGITGTVATGNTVAWSTLFGRTATDLHTLTVAQLPAHAHTFPTYQSVSTSDNKVKAGTGALSNLSPGTTNNTGSGSGHQHSIDMRVKYYDVVVATKS